MSSVSGRERSTTSHTVAYDHVIDLVDSTEQKDENIDSGDASSDSILVAEGGGGSQLNRHWTRPTRPHLRQELARRKYAKWQEEADEEAVPKASLDSNDNILENRDVPKKAAKQGTWGTQGRLRDKVPFRSKKKTSKASAKDTTFIDVLYENQRGAFFCGIPLYSAKSLLNLDPSGWQTSTFQDSPVNITNAQVPDPNWAWDWRTWYVDMSHDVDEEGWEYSFSFSPNFAWHGNHPWLYSFCRRRRWLRKRVHIHAHLNEKREGRASTDGHKLAADYFTIHAARRERSRSTSGHRSARRRSSTLAGFQTADDDSEDPDDVSNVTVLMQVMKRARIDREKIRAVKQFLEQGADELAFLAETMSSIMDDFVYQTSREQLQTILLQALNDAIDARNAGKDENTSDETEARKRRVNNLVKAVDAAGIPTSDQSYLSTLKARASGEDTSPINQSSDVHADTAPRVGFTDASVKHTKQDEASDDEIKGISKDAEISIEPGIRRPNTETEDLTEHVEEEKIDKGKGREKT